MLKVQIENKGGPGGKIRPGRRLYLTADRSRVVEEGDPKGATLYCSEHKEVPAAELAALLPAEPASEPEPEPEDKAVSIPPEVKRSKKRPVKRGKK